MSKKSLEDYFADWECEFFGFGYGTGEPHTIKAVKQFLMLCPDNGTYNHKHIEKMIGVEVAWLVLNTLCGADIIEYGTSPRFGWLTASGKRLKAFMHDHSIEGMVSMTQKSEDYFYCTTEECACGAGPVDSACPNPFWSE